MPAAFLRPLRCVLGAAALFGAFTASGESADTAKAETEIRGAIASIREAILARSAEGIVRRATPDWKFTGPDGVSFDRPGFVVRTERLFARVIAIESLDTTVDRVDFRGPDHADVEITMVMVRTERAADGSSASRLRLRYREHHAWIRTSEGWRGQSVEFIGPPERTTLAPEPPIPASERATLLAALARDREELDRALAGAPDHQRFLSRRGDARLFSGDAAGAVADFRRMIALDPVQDAPHWRLGIAYLFAGRAEESSRQFARYHSHDSADRENGLWKFLADAQAGGIESARRSMLGYQRFDREPFPALYELFAGRITLDDFFLGLGQRRLATDPKVMFFAHYYAGLHEQLAGHRAVARVYLREAVANPWARTVDNGPTYMWYVARLHHEALARDDESR